MSDKHHTYSISSPAALSTLAVEISSYTTSSPSSEIEIELRLLEPLYQEDVRASCYNHPGTLTRYSYNNTNSSTATAVALSIVPLFEAWRKTWSTFPFQAARKFTFDVKLPSPFSTADGTTKQFYWSYYVPEDKGLAIVEEQLSRAVQELASVMSVRSRRTIILALSGVEEYRYRRAQSSKRGTGYFQDLEQSLVQLSP